MSCVDWPSDYEFLKTKYKVEMLKALHIASYSIIATLSVHHCKHCLQKRLAVTQMSVSKGLVKEMMMHPQTGIPRSCQKNEEASYKQHRQRKISRTC